MEYQKIDTLFLRDEKNIIIPNMFTNAIFEELKDLKWECTEKIDGCLAWNTRIKMADGSVKLISEIQEGDIVLGYDTENNTGVHQVVVQKVSKRPADGTWVKIKVSHKGLGSSNSYGNIICTFDHKIWTTNRGYVEAYKLTKEDKILSIRRDDKLSPIQEQILVGKMLGDGSFECNTEAKTATIQFGHSNHEMTLWTLQGLQELAGNTYHRISGYGSDILVGRTKRSRQIYDTFISWFEKEEKQVPKDILLTPISLAFWYMDDGALLHNENQEDRVRFATNGFDEESCSYLQRELKLRFNIDSTLTDYKGNTICLNSENSEKLFLLVAPYICNSYKYKLPVRYRDCVSYLPKSKESQYHTELVEQEVLEITKEEKSYVRWDLTTETHNFFTTTGLVHNTNMRVEIMPLLDDNFKCVDAHIEFKGRTDKAQIPDHLLKKMNELFKKEKLIEVFNLYEKPANITIFGEGYGIKIQKGGNYIKNDCGFILFDVRVEKWWLQRDALEEIAKQLEIPIVPLIGYMTIPEACDYVKKGFKSTIAENKDYDAEGLVLKTQNGLLFRNGNRIITKIKTCDFQKYKNVYGDGIIEQSPNPNYCKK